MKTEVTLELRNKIRKEMKIVSGYGLYPNGDYCGILYFDDDESKLFEECMIWKKMLDTYFKTAYEGGKLRKVGRFLGIKPMTMQTRSVEFAVSMYRDPSWKDWFNIEGENDDPILIGGN